MYVEKYSLRKIENPAEYQRKPGKPYSVSHYIPRDGGTWIARENIKYFKTLEEAKEYKRIQEEKLKEKEGKKQ